MPLTIAIPCCLPASGNSDAHRYTGFLAPEQQTFICYSLCCVCAIARTPVGVGRVVAVAKVLHSEKISLCGEHGGDCGIQWIAVMSGTSHALTYAAYKALERDEEYELIRRCQAGDAGAKNRLARLLMPYLKVWIGENEQWITAATPLDELMQVAWTWFDRALERFDFEKGYRFWTYFKTWAFKAIQAFIELMFNRKGQTDYQAWLSLDYDDGEGHPMMQLGDDEQLFEQVETQLMHTRWRAAIREALEVYDLTIQQIVLLRLGEGLPWKVVAERLGMKAHNCVNRLQKVKGELRDNLEYVLDRRLTLEEIGAFDGEVQLSSGTGTVETTTGTIETVETVTETVETVAVEAATETVETVEAVETMAARRARVLPWLMELLQNKFEMFLSLGPNRYKGTVPTGDGDRSICTPPRWTDVLMRMMALVRGLLFGPPAGDRCWSRGHPGRLRGPCVRGQPLVSGRIDFFGLNTQIDGRWWRQRMRWLGSRGPPWRLATD